jgi:hypothetical protein
LSDIKVLGAVRALRKVNVTAVLSVTYEMAKGAISVTFFS